MLVKYSAKIIIILTIVLFLSSISMNVANADWTLDGEGVSTTATVKPEDDEEGEATPAENGEGTEDEDNDNDNDNEVSVPEVYGEVNEEGALIADVDFDKDSEFSVVVSEVCKIVEKVTLKVNDDVDGQVKVTYSEENPTETEIEKNLGFCKFELVDIDSSAIESATWELLASRDKLSKENWNKDSMKLMVLENGKWTGKDTERVDGDSENYIYEATTNNLGEGVITLSSAKSSLFTLKNGLYCLGSLIGLGILLVIGYLLMSRSEEKSSKK